MICLWPQNMPVSISLLHWSQTSLPGEFFWDLQTASSHRGPDLENRVGMEEIQSTIHVALPLLQSTYDMVHSLGERVLFSSYVAIFGMLGNFSWKVIGCILVLESILRSSFITGWFMVHSAVLGRIVLCIILGLILISFRRIWILRLKGLWSFLYFQKGFYILFLW